MDYEGKYTIRMAQDAMMQIVTDALNRERKRGQPRVVVLDMKFDPIDGRQVITVAPVPKQS